MSCLCQGIKGHTSLGSLFEGELVSVIVLLFVYVFVIVFFDHVMSSHHSDQMSQRSKVVVIWAMLESKCSFSIDVFPLIRC